MGDALPAVDLGMGRTAKAVAAGSAHVCAILDTSAVKCWGRNDKGQLGLGDTDDRGDAPGEMGNALPTVNLGGGRTAKAIALGDSHTCAILDNDTLKCWGDNAEGQLGLEDTSVRGDAPGEMGNALPLVDVGTGRTPRALSLGYRHTCAILDNAAVKCWGANATGELGAGDQKNRGGATGQMGDALPFVAMGTGRTAKSLTGLGVSHCILLDDDTIKCWGSGFNGALGQGDTASRGDGPIEMGDQLPRVTLVGP
jgi:alpha-tubulin suppressor-like RCC1 family protein